MTAAATRTSALASCIKPQQQKQQALLPLRAEQLKRLSFLCGLPVSGRKDELAARLALACATGSTSSKPQQLPAKSRSVSGSQPVVLSIDLGIKNLAFSLLTPVASLRKLNAAGVGAADGGNITGPPAIELHTWKRLSFLDPYPHSISTSTTTTPSKQQNETVTNEEVDVETSTSIFSPPALAKTANTFLQETVLKLRPLPTHILIERQRWRSGGAAAIQEWTVRVNTLEAMLHASLRTLRDLGVWKGEVVPVTPERVGQFFLLGSDSDPDKALKLKEAEEENEVEVEGEDIPASGERASSRRKKNKTKPKKTTTNAETKKAKIALLTRWLDEGDLIIRPANAEAGNMVDAYRTAVNRTKSKRSSNTIPNTTSSSSKLKSKSKSKAKPASKEDVLLTQGEEEEEEEREGRGEREKGGEALVKLDKKLDDLTDSLMQGMVWLRWQENMALLRSEGGVEKLLQRA